jgi:hypothetical protein
MMIFSMIDAVVAFYSLIAMSCGFIGFFFTSRLFPFASSTDLLLLHASSLVWFTEGLYAAYPFVAIADKSSRVRFWNTVSLAKLVAAVLLIARAGPLFALASFIAAFESLYAIVVIFGASQLAVEQSALAPVSFSLLLVFAQGSHAATAGPFGAAIALFPADVAGLLTGVAVGVPSVAFDAALALGALESTMTIAYALSAVYSQRETSQQFARCSVVSRLVAAVALLVAFALGVGHAKALGGVGPGIVSALLTAIALRQQRSTSKID